MYSAIDSNKRRTWLLVAFFVGFFSLIGWAMGLYYEAGPIFIPWALGFSGVTAAFSYYKGDTIALWSTGARPATKEEFWDLYTIVENLSIAAGQPMPKVYVIQDPAPNAFATGRDPKHASIAVTTGLLERLEKVELEGVIAHELSHVKNYDIRLMTIVVVLVGAIVLLRDVFFRSGMRTRGDQGGDRRRGGGGNILAIVGIVLIVLSPIIAELIKLAISRRREYLADADGALLTRYPDGLARALEKIGAHATPLRTASDANAHLFIVSPFGPSKHLANLFSTHPPVQDRIAKLRAMISVG
ncbi:M48 family metallopeptidase [Candidatus Uhrbacteria bacterium]|nr:M48 family metallopeptidase [Candidatus Uhrbacteria bacterium]